jgi:hypothetical protein
MPDVRRVHRLVGIYDDLPKKSIKISMNTRLFPASGTKKLLSTGEMNNLGNSKADL